MRMIQNRVLPDNWVEKVKQFNIEESDLNDKNKIIAHALSGNIIKEKEKSLLNGLSKNLVFNILYGEELLPSKYNFLPLDLVEDAFYEIKGEKGINLSRKLHSIFVEFLTYLDLSNKGYTIVKFKREEGSCDLKLQKDGQVHNFEVKFKESKDIGMSRLYDYLDAYSLLNENSFLRNKIFKITLKVENLTYSNIKGILKEIDEFIERKEDLFDGKSISISTLTGTTRSRDITQVTREIESMIINQVVDVNALINELFIENNGHITKLMDKSQRPENKDNFTGYLVWSIPFHMEIDNKDIEKAFNTLGLNFDLHVSVGGISHKEFNFIVKKKE
ncbi:hypothetical protein [Aliarcobacter butzleri]|uniref:hypothetical protein n=1 Tax=Aliarcobacter butzleri TaxID=28197 RepID=UPI001919B9F2|nr:hypothetical protein [Aliarcobacter butzleri]